MVPAASLVSSGNRSYKCPVLAIDFPATKHPGKHPENLAAQSTYENGYFAEFAPAYGKTDGNYGGRKNDTSMNYINFGYGHWTYVRRHSLDIEQLECAKEVSD